MSQDQKQLRAVMAMKEDLEKTRVREKELKTAEGYSVVQVEAGGQHSCLILAKNQVGGKRKSY